MFDAVEADPSRATLLAAVEAAERRVASVVGFGGGSPMDVAKLAAYLLGTGDDARHDLGRRHGDGRAAAARAGPDHGGHRLRATAVSVITVGGASSVAVNAPPLIADWAVLDPELTLGLPRHVTAATGIDAMVHAIEAYTSARRKNPLSDMFAREALRLLAQSAHRLRAARDLEARAAMLLGAHLAGLAFDNAPVAGVHALAYPLGGHFHVPHGLSNALMLTHVLGHNMEAARDHYAELGAILDPDCAGLGSRRRRRASSSIWPLSPRSGLPQRLRDRHRLGAPICSPRRR